MDTLSAAYLSQATYGDGSCGAVFKGCTDSTAGSYRSLANRARPEDCEYIGCLRSNALDFDPSATRAGLCTSRKLGCADPAAVNFVSGVNVDSECLYAGCTDSHAPNWDPSATVDSGRCVGLLPGCTDSHFVNYLAHCNHDDGSCSRGGCMDIVSPAYDSLATFDDGLSCSYRRLLLVAAGCRDPSALTYNSQALLHAQSACVYAVPGCTDSAADNYLSIANVAPSAANPSSCWISLLGCTLSEETLNFDSVANLLDGCVYRVEGCTESGTASLVAIGALLTTHPIPAHSK